MASHNHHVSEHDLEEKFVFSDGLRKVIFTLLAIGLFCTVLGIVLLSMGGGEHATEGHALALNDKDNITLVSNENVESEGHHAYHWLTRVKANLWLNVIFFMGITVIGLFFTALQYASHSGWSALIKRVPEAYGAFFPYIGAIMAVVFVWSFHELFHWTDESLLVKGGKNYDEIIAGKSGFLNMWGFAIRAVIFVLGWYAFYTQIRKNSLLEDLHGGTKYFWKMKTISTVFIIFFGISESISAWDWILSIDTHWFSTMFGWYVFASWHVTGLATIALAVMYLKDAGYLKMVNENHLHDLGKFVFAFSVFWTYIWFAQFLLVYYANIPEETVYFMERLNSDYYKKFIFINLFLNFFFPFLGLMTRNAKRKAILLKIVCFVVIVGHFLDFYLMIMPGTLKEHGGFGFLEIGMPLVFAAIFIFVVARNLAKPALIAKNHPMLDESIHHHI